MPEDSTKSCLMQMVKTVAVMATQLDAHTTAFTSYVLDERETHKNIDKAIITLRARLDTLIIRVGGFVILLLLGIAGFLLIKVMGW